MDDRISQWDERLEEACQKAESLLPDGEVDEQLFSQISQLSLTVKNQERELNKKLELLMGLSGKKGVREAEEKSLLMWVGKFAQKAQSIDQFQRECWAYYFWGKLYGAILMGPSENLKSQVLTRHHADRLVQRIRQLETNIKKIQEDTNEHEYLKSALYKRYNKLLVLKANREAAGSFFASLASNLVDALRNPTIMGFRDLLLSLAGLGRVKNKSNFLAKKPKKKQYIKKNAGSKTQRTPSATDVPEIPTPSLLQEMMEVQNSA